MLWNASSRLLILLGSLSIYGLNKKPLVPGQTAIDSFGGVNFRPVKSRVAFFAWLNRLADF